MNISIVLLMLSALFACAGAAVTQSSFSPAQEAPESQAAVVVQNAKSALELCGEGAFHADDLEGSIEACNLAIEEDPTNGDIYYFRAFNHYYSGRVEEAEADFTRAIELKTKRLARSYYQRGICRERLERHQEAEEDFRMALELRPEWSLAQRKVAEYDAAFFDSGHN